MNFNQSNSNNREATNVNTTGTQFRNSQGSSPSAMVIGYWNSLLSIKMHPALEKSQQNEQNVFNYDKLVSTAITLEKMIVLSNHIEDTIFPAIKAGVSAFKGVPVGDTTLVGVGVTIEEGAPVAYFVIYKGLDETSKKPESFLKYNFRTSYTVDNYDPIAGTHDITQGVQGELASFLALMKAATVGLSNSTVHADRHVNKFFRDKLMTRIEDIAGKVGLPSQKSGNGSGYSNRSSNGGVFSSQSSQPARSEGNYEAPIATLDNIEDIDSYI
jgi:hypothetical protein